MLGSLMRWSCLVLLLLVATDCKPPRPYRSRGKTAKSAAHDRTPTAQPLVLPPAVPSALPSAVSTLPLPPNSAEGTPRKARSALERREACEFEKGAMPEQTLSAEGPLGQRIPIDHF